MLVICWIFFLDGLAVITFHKGWRLKGLRGEKKVFPFWASAPFDSTWVFSFVLFKATQWNDCNYPLPMALTRMLLAENGKKDWAYELYTAYDEVKYFKKNPRVDSWVLFPKGTAENSILLKISPTQSQNNLNLNDRTWIRYNMIVMTRLALIVAMGGSGNKERTWEGKFHPQGLQIVFLSVLLEKFCSRNLRFQMKSAWEEAPQSILPQSDWL